MTTQLYPLEPNGLPCKPGRYIHEDDYHELLEALKRSQEWLEEALTSEPEDFENAELIARIKANEQAIAKAEGR